jgi:Family of unknown function (DUF6504)
VKGAVRVTKRYDEAIEVTPDPAQGGAPLFFSWRGRRYEVDQWLMSWREAGEWWQQPSSNGVREQEFFRVVARPSGTFATGELDADGFMRHAGGVYDVYLDRVRHEWRLARVWD